MSAIADDTEELAEVFGDERLYVFLASRPTSTDKLREQLARLAAARLSDKQGTAQHNWTVRRRGDGRAVGMLQAAFSDQGRAATSEAVIYLAMTRLLLRRRCTRP